MQINGKLPHQYRLAVDDNGNRPEEIVAFFNCIKCLEEIQDMRSLGIGVSPREYKRLDVGFTDAGTVQIWCSRHECNVAVVCIVKVPDEARSRTQG